VKIYSSKSSHRKKISCRRRGAEPTSGGQTTHGSFEFTRFNPIQELDVSLNSDFELSGNGSKHIDCIRDFSEIFPNFQRTFSLRREYR